MLGNGAWMPGGGSGKLGSGPLALGRAVMLGSGAVMLGTGQEVGGGSGSRGVATSVLWVPEVEQLLMLPTSGTGRSLVSWNSESLRGLGSVMLLRAGRWERGGARCSSCLSNSAAVVLAVGLVVTLAAGAFDAGAGGLMLGAKCSAAAPKRSGPKSADVPAR
eukprot:scaffold11196_cov19-Tisochrysis_lutea.AAC.1